MSRAGLPVFLPIRSHFGNVGDSLRPHGAHRIERGPRASRFSGPRDKGPASRPWRLPDARDETSRQKAEPPAAILISAATGVAAAPAASSASPVPASHTLNLSFLQDPGQPPDPAVYYAGQGLLLQDNIYQGLVQYEPGTAQRLISPGSGHQLDGFERRPHLHVPIAQGRAVPRRHAVQLVCGVDRR